MKYGSTLLALAVATRSFLAVNSASAQGTAFIYQGRLNDGGSPAHGAYDLRFKLYADSLGSTQIGGSFLTNAIAVSNGLFVTAIDFGGGIFNGSNYWLEVDVKTNSAGSYAVLAPLQAVTPTPYAMFANTAGNLSGALPAAQLSGTIANGNLPASPNFSGAVSAGSFSGGGASLTGLNANNLSGGTVPLGRLSGLTSSQLDAAAWQLATNLNGGNAASLGGLGSSNFWQLGGNNVAAGQFIGSTNNQPVELWVNGVRALHLEGFNDPSYSNMVNVVNGSSANYAAPGVHGATISGGGAGYDVGFHFTNSVTQDFGTVSGGSSNTSSGYAATVGGGQYNTSSGNKATVGGGEENTSSGIDATVGGGQLNTSSGQFATVGGGAGDISSGYSTTVGGGLNNQATNFYATVPGGAGNLAGGTFSFAAGDNAQATNNGAFVWADAQGTAFGSTTTNQFNVRANGGARFVTSGAGMTLDGQSVLAGSNGGGLTNVTASQLKSGATLTNLTLNGALTLPAISGGSPDLIYSGSSLLLYADNNDNLFSGQGAGNLTTSGSDNIAIGASALFKNTSGSGNTAIGIGALDENNSGSNNTASGGNALTYNVSGSDNTANGYQALFRLGFNNGAGGSNNIALGYNAGSSFLNNESSNIDIGNLGVAGENNTIRIGTPGLQTNTFIAGAINGNGGGLTNVTASQLKSGATLTNLTLNGALTLPAISGGNPDLIYSGSSLLLYADNNDNLFSGQDAGNLTTSGTRNTAIGHEALLNNTSGFQNTATGDLALFGNTNGFRNTATGQETLYKNTSGSDNLANGREALFNNMSGSDNTAVGDQALFNLGLNTVAGGSNNIALGYFAGMNLAGNESSNIDIGNLGVLGDNNTIRIGTPGLQTNTFIAGAINGNGSGLTNLSAAQLTGTVADARLSANAALLNANQTFTGANTFANSVTIAPGNGTLTITNDGGIVPGIVASGGGASGHARFRNALEIWPNNAATAPGYLDVRGTNGVASIALDGQTGVTLSASNSISFGSQTRQMLNLFSSTYGIGVQSNDEYFRSASEFYWYNGGVHNDAFGNAGGGTQLMRLSSVGNLVVPGTVTANGVLLTSDRNAKENFTALDGRSVLAKVAALPITEWNYKTGSAEVRHVGPMAQDFHAAFQLDGSDDLHISVVDEGGVALAAIQGLNQKVDEKETEIEKLKQQNIALEKRLNELQQVVQALVGKK